jgi:hypothetical protein
VIAFAVVVSMRATTATTPTLTILRIGSLPFSTRGHDHPSNMRMTRRTRWMAIEPLGPVGGQALSVRPSSWPIVDEASAFP